MPYGGDISKLEYLYSRLLRLSHPIIEHCKAGRFVEAIDLLWNTPDKETTKLVVDALNITSWPGEVFDFLCPLDLAEHTIRVGSKQNLPDTYDILKFTSFYKRCPNCTHAEFDHMNVQYQYDGPCRSYYCDCSGTKQQTCDCPLAVLLSVGCQNKNHC